MKKLFSLARVVNSLGCVSILSASQVLAQVPAGLDMNSAAALQRATEARASDALPSIRSSAPVAPPVLVTESKQVDLKPLGPNEFQKFVTESSGQSLPLYGLDFFSNSQSAGNPYAPISNTPVTADYPLGAGDEVLIRGWGSIDIDVRAVIDRNGLISIPRVGTVSLSGVKASEAQGVIRAAIAKNFKDFELNVTFGQLRSITVYVVGQARRPGTYNLSSLSTLVSGLFASGGPTADGSMRTVQLKRGNQLVTEFDLYAFLSQGNKTADAKLLDGDVIVIPPAYGHVALTGKVTTPAVYEIKNESETLEQLLAVAGGLPVVADPRKAYLERITPGTSQPRRVEEFALDASGLKRTLKKGDVLNVISMVPEFANAVTLRGNVSQPQRLPFKEGMRIRDLIPSKESLISRASVARQNSALGELKNQETLAGQVGNLIDQINLDYAVVERVDRANLNVQLMPFNLGRVLANANDPDNLQLQAGDIITVFSVNDVRVPLAKRRVYVRVEGEVARPGVYQMTPGETLQTLLDKAGGLTKDAYLYGSEFYREEVKKSQAENLQRLLRRLEGETAGNVTQLTQSQGASADPTGGLVKLQAAQAAQRQALERLRSLQPTGRIALDMPADTANTISKVPPLRIQNSDRLVVPSKPDFVYVFGSVNTESALIYKPGKTVAEYLEQSGQASGADRDNVILVRVDGSALTSTGNWGNSVMRTVVMPGDTIVMPEKVDRETAWSAFTRNAKDLTQIFYNLGLGAAAIKTLRQ